MECLTSELKSVTALTSFNAVRVFDQGMERIALIDQDGHIVGLVGRELPYFIQGTFEETSIVAQKALRQGATYKAYYCSPFGRHHYIVRSVLKSKIEFSEIPEVRKVEESANDAIELLYRVNLSNCSDVPLEPDEKCIN